MGLLRDVRTSLIFATQATIHSEINAICDCAKRGVTLNGAKIYITHYPCLKTICSSGIVEIIYLEDYNNDELVAHVTNIVIRKLDKK
jgi:dCMP deaminase